MVFHCRREIANRHCIFWCKKLRLNEPNQIITQKNLKKNFMTNIYKYLAKILANKFVKFLTLIVYLGYLMFSVKWILQLPLGKKIFFFILTGFYVVKKMSVINFLTSIRSISNILSYLRIF